MAKEVELSEEEKHLAELVEREKKAKAMGAVHVIEMGEGLEKRVIFLRKLQRSIVSNALTKGATDPLLSAEMLINSHAITEYSDMHVIADSYEDTSYFFTAVAVVQGLIQAKAGELRRL